MWRLGVETHLYIPAYSIWHLYTKSEKNGILEHHTAANIERAIYIVAEPGSCYGIAQCVQAFYGVRLQCAETR